MEAGCSAKAVIRDRLEFQPAGRSVENLLNPEEDLRRFDFGLRSFRRCRRFTEVGLALNLDHVVERSEFRLRSFVLP